MGIKKKKAIIIGWVNRKNHPTCGETMKNQLMIKELTAKGIRCQVLDYYRWKHRPWILLQTAWAILANPRSNLVLTSSAKNIYPLMRLLKLLHTRHNIIHWVIGGMIADRVKEGTFKASVLNYANYTLVETQKMVDDLRAQGIRNVTCVPNFKPISYIPSIPRKNGARPLKFVFLSRVMPEKGVDDIIESAEILNSEGLKSQFTVDFYGPCKADYEETFLKKIDGIENVSYHGLLDLRGNEGFEKLASHHVMLFPTHWHNEGFAGIFIDAFICGLPMILTDWNHNRSICGESGFYIPAFDRESLTAAMRDMITGDYDLDKLSEKMQSAAKKYDSGNVVSYKLINRVFR